MNTAVDQIKQKVGIVELVSSYVKLEKAGANLKGKCPFHNEKSPSFFLSPSRNTYYCFGCGVKGDIFSFVQEFEKVDFKGALKILAERAGVTLSDFNPEQAKERDTLFNVLQEATLYFQKKLEEKKEAYDYLIMRGLTPETIKEWRIGFAPMAWNELGDEIRSKHFKDEDAEKVGLIKKREGEKGFYDRFRGRIMFPLFDPSSRVVGFSGRLFEDGKTERPNEAKYLNSPDTVLFNKSELLYGYHKAKNAIREKNFALLVEGQMDLLMCHQIGLSQTVATSGTALTEGQLQLLKRSSSNLMIAYDGDKAGISASKRAFVLALSLGFDVKMAPLPTGSDPADAIKENPEQFKLILRKSQHIIDFSLQTVLKKNLEGRELLKEIKEHVLPFVEAAKSPVERAYFISRIAEAIHLPEQAINEELNISPSSFKSKIVEQVKQQLSQPPKVVPSVISKKESIERNLAGFYWSRNDAMRVVMESIFQRLFEDMESLSFQSVLTPYEEERDKLIFEAEREFEKVEENDGVEDEKPIRKHFEELSLAFKKEILKNELVIATADLKLAEKEKDSERIAGLLKTCNELTKRLSYLKI